VDQLKDPKDINRHEKLEMKNAEVQTDPHLFQENSISFSNPPLEISAANSESQQSDISSASTIYYLKDIRTCPGTERSCTVCGSLTGRNRIPKAAILQVWTEKTIFIPISNRTCSSHLANGMFNEDALERINTTQEGVKMSGKDLGQWLLDISHRKIDSRPLSKFCTKSMESESYSLLFGLTEANFEDLFTKYVKRSEMRDSSIRLKRDALAMLLLFLRQNLSQTMIGFLFNCSQTVVSDSIRAVSQVLEETFVAQFLGYNALPREECVQKHSRILLQEVLGIAADRLAIIADGTYLYVEQPMDIKMQRLLFSGQKKRNLVKVMMLVLPSGHILDADGPYGANGTNNDSSILKCMTLTTPMM